ncbi:SNF2-related protein [Diaphorobacter caeni]|uniref:SNF2-related protein n=1 Tax=Diaphorobacter caeni TaxID=2784387 RepID=UPI00188FAA07|nr:SNF2-related protein [Diaphorobacter caeni]MBF5006179.1 restriction endonuclease [Diaphorobacter caeni]
MGLFDIFRRSPAGSSSKTALATNWTAEGVVVKLASPLPTPTAEALQDTLAQAGAADTVLGVYLAQLAMEGLCEIRRDSVMLPWGRVYEISENPEHQGMVQLLNLPQLGALRPILSCSGTLSDASFEIEVAGWADAEQSVKIEQIDGAVAIVGGNPQLLNRAAWTTVDEISKFPRRDASARTQHENELAWGRIRSTADQAGALYATSYLETTYVLTPQTLRLPVSKEETSFGRVLTVAPTFQGAPDGWLKAFDGFNAVQPHYDMTRGAGRVRVVISEPVRKVLEVVKREMPGRRVAGSRAEKFIHNPFAFLGDAAHDVIDEKEFEAGRAELGAVAAIFNVVPRIEDGRLNAVDLSVTEHFGDGAVRHNTSAFKDQEQFAEFVLALEQALVDDREYFPWEEYDLTIDAEATTQLEQAQQLLSLWKAQPSERISFEDIYELEGYSGRIEGIGVAKAIYIPVFQPPNKDGEQENGWLPQELTPMVRVSLPPHEGAVVIPLSVEWVDEFRRDVLNAEQSGASDVTNVNLPTPVATADARNLLDGFTSMLAAADRVKGDGLGAGPTEPARRETLLLKTNFNAVNYQESEESRRASLTLPLGASAVLPCCLRAGIKLKAHQLHGVAWFQNLVSKGPSACRGALLGDDMGLGKTLQLLSLLAWYYEHNPNAAPSIIFAPKSLLENWANEVKKFFTPSFPDVLVLYGEELKALKQPAGLIDEQVRANGIIELLKPKWVGSSKLVITTYETLTSYEFSLARQPFSFVICDEAQRIKTPGTLVTLAAKKLKADFRIACTGTPVENSLADLWCLFDFVQPGLLGALEEFGKTYRRPIECDTDEQKESLVRLQGKIAPQTLRRTKADIAAELPKKYFAHKRVDEKELGFKQHPEVRDRLEIAITDYQRTLYMGGLKKLQDATNETDGRKRARLSFGALHLMKAVCAEPYCLPGTKFLLDGRGKDAHLANSPKMHWLLEQLEKVQKSGQKAIVFTELREAQAALYYFLREQFGIKPFIINGDSQGRQGYIDKFSAKDGFDVIILSTLAAGAGLNVTAANHVFHFTRMWNPAKESQATDRAFRIGQERDVFVYCPTIVADFETFDVRLDELMKKKAGLADSTLDKDALVSMLNGVGQDASLTDLVGGEHGKGAMLPKRFLTMDDVERMDGFGFEVLCCLLWSRRGYIANITEKRGGDGGIDVVAINGSEGELIQCKSSKSAEVGWDAVKEVAAGAARYQTRFSGTRFKKVAVTNQGFTSGAFEQAAANQVHLVTRAHIEEWLGAKPISNYEFDEALLAEADR